MNKKMYKVFIIIGVICIATVIACATISFINHLNSWNTEVENLYSDIKEKTGCISDYKSIKSEKILYIQYDIYGTPYYTIYKDLWDMEDRYPDIYFEDCSKQMVFDSMWEAVFPYIKKFADENDAKCVYFTVLRSPLVTEAQYYYNRDFNYVPDTW